MCSVLISVAYIRQGCICFHKMCVYLSSALVSDDVTDVGHHKT